MTESRMITTRQTLRYDSVEFKIVPELTKGRLSRRAYVLETPWDGFGPRRIQLFRDRHCGDYMATADWTPPSTPQEEDADATATDERLRDRSNDCCGKPGDSGLLSGTRPADLRPEEEVTC